MNKRNLTKLANYLDTLPDGYKHFDMNKFYADRFDGFFTSETNLNECGAVACAVGHGLVAGITPLPHHWAKSGRINWASYSDDLFLRQSDAWDFMFASGWAVYDNSPRGAAARIRYVLSGGEIPDPRDLKDFYDTRRYQMFGA